MKYINTLINSLIVIMISLFLFLIVVTFIFISNPQLTFHLSGQKYCHSPCPYNTADRIYQENATYYQCVHVDKCKNDSEYCKTVTIEKEVCE